MAITVIFTPSFRARPFLGVLVRMAIISFTIPAVSWHLSWSFTLVPSTDDGVAFPVSVHPLVLIVSCLARWCRSSCPQVRMSRDSVCRCPSQ